MLHSYWRIIFIFLFFAIVILLINRDNFDKKYISKDEVVKNLLAYNQVNGEFNNQIIKDFNVFCNSNYKIVITLGMKFAKEIPVKHDDFFDNIYVERKAVHSFLITRRHTKY